MSRTELRLACLRDEMLGTAREMGNLEAKLLSQQLEEQFAALMVKLRQDKAGNQGHHEEEGKKFGREQTTKELIKLAKARKRDRLLP